MDRDKWIVIIVIIAIIILLVWAIFNIKVCPEIDKPTVAFDEIKHQLKTGDVIATHGCHLLRSAVMRKYLGCKATHVGMVIRKPDDLYVIELGPHGFHPTRKTDVKKSTLRKFLSKGKHNVFALIPTAEEIEWTEEDEEKYGDVRFNYFIPTMFSPYKGYKV